MQWNKNNHTNDSDMILIKMSTSLATWTENPEQDFFIPICSVPAVIPSATQAASCLLIAVQCDYFRGRQMTLCSDLIHVQLMLWWTERMHKHRSIPYIWALTVPLHTLFNGCGGGVIDFSWLCQLTMWLLGNKNLNNSLKLTQTFHELAAVTSACPR